MKEIPRLKLKINIRLLLTIDLNDLQELSKERFTECHAALDSYSKRIETSIFVSESKENQK